jgi:5'-3' exonuclease
MGIPNFLSPVLNSAGREVDLQDYANRKEPLRVAIDISSWIHRACFAHSDILADEKHLDNYGRATLQYQDQLQQQHQHQQQQLPDQQVVTDEAESAGGEPNVPGVNKNLTLQEKQLIEFISKACNTVMDYLRSFQEATKAEILIVLDGATPPMKSTTVADRGVKLRLEQEYRDLPVDSTAASPALERRLQANRRAGAGDHYVTVIEAVLVTLRSNNTPFLVAPYEADAQLAFLQINGYVDLVITDDSDLISYGLATPILYNLSRNARGLLSRGIIVRKDDLAAIVPGAIQKNAFDFMDFTPPMLACLFASLGCDYCSKLRGIGPGMACRDVRAAFYPTKSCELSPLERLLKLLLHSTWDRDNLTADERDCFERDFVAAVFMYRHATIFDPVHMCCRPMIPLDEADVELTSYGHYAAILRNESRIRSIVGKPFPAKIATYIAEGWICPKSMCIRKNVFAPIHIQIDLDQFLSESPFSLVRNLDGIMETQTDIFPPNCIAVQEVRLLAEATPGQDEPHTQLNSV